ncbi:MAG: aldo/keto reductase [Pseudomonadota bacterium]
MTRSLEESPGSGRLILGLASLHHFWSPSTRQRYLNEAMDLGFRDFDVAPSYGNGLNERELGVAIRTGRDKVSVATKFGVVAPMYGALSRAMFYPFRLVDRVIPGYRSRNDQRDYSVANLRSSIEGSLRRMKTDYVDYLLLHEPPEAKVSALLADVRAEIESLKSAGKIRTFGLATDYLPSGATADAAALELLQMPLNSLLASTLPEKVRCRAYFLYRSYRNSGSTLTYEAFVKSMRLQHPSLDLLVSSRSMARLEALIRELQ